MNRRRWGEEDEGGTCHSDAEMIAVIFANVFNEVDGMLEAQVGRSPFFLSSWWIWRDETKRWRERDSPPRRARMFWMPHFFAA